MPDNKVRKAIAMSLLVVFMTTLFPAVSMAEIENQSNETANTQTDDVTTPLAEMLTKDAEESIVLTLSVLTDNNLFRVVGESGATTIDIVIKDNAYVAVKEASLSVTSGRFDWSEALSEYTAGCTYWVYITDNLGNTINERVTIPEKEDSYTLNLNALAGSSYFTVAGESSCANVSITVKSNTFVTIVSTTAAVSAGRFEWNSPISNYTKGASYSVTVKDPNGHTSSQNVAIPEDMTAVTPDDYTLTLLITMKDRKLKIAGESSEGKVYIVIRNDSLSEVGKKSIDVKNGKYSWSQAITDFDEDEIYTVTVTDKKEHKTSQQVTIPITVKSIEFADYEKKLEVDKTVTLSVAVLPSGAQSQTVTYESSDRSVATVSAGGKVTGKSPGNVKITATVGDVSTTADLTVYIKAVKIQLNETYIVLLPNDTFQIDAEVIPKTASQEYKYISTNERVTTVSSTGVVTARDKGVASVIVSNGSADGILTIVVNGSDDGTVGFLHSGSVDTMQEDHLDASALSNLIKTYESKDVALSNTDLDVIDSTALLTLKDEEKNLIIDKGTYLIRMKGKDIINPGNELITEIPIEVTEDNVKFIINNEEPLPGAVLIQLRGSKIQTMKYLYLYNSVKNKYEKLDTFNTDDKSIHLDKGGIYLLTAKKLHGGSISWKIGAGAGSICVILTVVYILMKRRYWFY